MDRLEAMTAFVAVTDLKGFAPAARRLGLSPSAVTRAVAALEDHLGVRLLQRTTRTVTLTDVGARYLERARFILAELEEADGSAQAERARPAGRLVVAAPLVFGRLHVAPLMCSFLNRYPEVTGALELSDRTVNLVEDGIDVAVRIGRLADSNLIARPMGTTRRVVVASPGYLGARGVPDGPDAIAGHRVIQCTAVTPGREWRFRVNGAERVVPVAPSYQTNSADAAVWHAERDGGLAMVLAYQAAEAIQAGRLAIVLAEHEVPALPIHVVYPTSRLLSSKVRAFIDTAAEICDWR